MRIALIGAGAIGGSIAACIAKQGYDLTVVAKYEEYASLIENQGIEITGVKGNFVQKIKAVAKVSQLTGKFDIFPQWPKPGHWWTDPDRLGRKQSYR